MIKISNDISLTSRGDITQKGSDVYSHFGDISYDAGGDIDILAGTNKYSSSEDSTDVHFGAQFNFNPWAMANWSLDLEMSFQDSEADQSQTWHTNSTVQTQYGNVSMTSGEDLTVKGGNIYGNTVNIEAENLTIESIQDTSDSSSLSYGASTNITVGKSGVKGFGASANASWSESESAWVNQQSGIVSNGELTVSVKDKTELIGGVIGSETGDMTLSTGSLEYRDIEDYDYSESYSIKTGQSWGTQPANQSDSTGKTPGSQGTSTDGGGLDKIDPSKGSNTLGGSIHGHDKEQLTKATIGEGTIIIKGEEQSEDSEAIDGLNRDLDATQVITRDEETGGLDAEITVSNDWFTRPGDKIKNILDLPGNLLDITDAIGAGVSTVVEKASVKVKDSVSNMLKGKVSPEEAGKAMTEEGLSLEEQGIIVANAVVEEAKENLNDTLDKLALESDFLDGYGTGEDVVDGIRDNKAEVFNIAYEEAKKSNPNLTKSEFLEQKVTELESLSKNIIALKDEYNSPTTNKARREEILSTLSTSAPNAIGLMSMLGMTKGGNAGVNTVVKSFDDYFDLLAGNPNVKSMEDRWTDVFYTGKFSLLDEMHKGSPNGVVIKDEIGSSGGAASIEGNTMYIDKTSLGKYTFQEMMEIYIHEMLHPLVVEWVDNNKNNPEIANTLNYRILSSSLALDLVKPYATGSSLYTNLEHENVVRVGTEVGYNRVLPNGTARTSVRSTSTSASSQPSSWSQGLPKKGR
ncbi:hemagluttinin repeat-containing protein [Parelusimicrobium proximum]|uniref:hemagglutinin repeat-containing protein n=1 Tax=Parelusimicrobium proximum TaxID=3228953 RepID=UPI003D181453